MKILYITSSPFFQERGACLRVLNLARATQEIGHDVHVASYWGGTDIENIKIFRTKYKYKVKHIGPGIDRIPMDISLLILSRKLVRENNYDVIHGEDIEGAFIGCVVKKNTPLIFDIHGDLPDLLNVYKFYPFKSILYIAEKLQRYVVMNSSMLIANWPLTEKKFKKYNVPIMTIEDLSPYQPSAYNLERGNEIKQKMGIIDRKIIFYSGNLAAYQGIDTYIDALPYIIEKVSDILLVIIGSRPKKRKSELEKKILDNDLGNYVKFVDVGGDDTAALMKSSNVLICPRQEGSHGPMKIISYLWAGVPIVATNIPSNRQILDENCAILSENDPYDLAEKTLIAIESSDLSISKNALKLAHDKYTLGCYNDKFKKIYKFVETGVIPR